jgi:hypothetical protein
VSSQLNIAWWTASAGDNAKQSIAGTAAGGIRVPEIRVIKRVERIDLHTERHLVMDPLCLGQRDVGVLITRADCLIQAGVADLIERRRGEAAGIKPLRCLPQCPHGRANCVVPLFRLSDVRWIVIGWPDCSVVMVLTCHPPTSASTARGLLVSHSRPRPKGSW